MAIHDIGQLGPIPAMNRARYRRAAAFARPGQREAHQHLCATGDCATGLATHVTIGNVSFPIPASLSRPFTREGDGLRRYRPLASMVGQTMSIPALAAVSERDPDSTAMLRATNLSSVVAVILTKVRPDQRMASLAVLSGSAATAKEWAESVMALAKKMPGGLGILDAIRFSLALHYLIGIGHDAIKRDTMYATAYRQAVKVYRDAELRVEGGRAQTQGLGTVSLAATPQAFTGKTVSKPDVSAGSNPAAAMRETGAKATVADKYAAPEAPATIQKCEWWDVACNMKNVAAAIEGGADKVAAAVKGAGGTAQEAVSKATDWAGEIICKGLKAIIPEPVGGFLCAVFTKGLELLTKWINSYVEVIVQLVDGLVEFVKAIVRLDLLGAVKALLNGVTKIIFVMDPIGPLFSTFLNIPLNKAEREKRISKGEKDVPKSLVELADALSTRSPFFILILVLAIVAVVTGPGRNSIGALIVALAPMVAIITAAILQQNKQFLKLTEVALATAIEKIIKITVVVIQGVMTLVEMFKMLWEKVRSYFEKQGGVAGGATTMANNLMKNFSAKWDKFWNTLTGPFKGATPDNMAKKNLSTNDINNALMDLLKFGPEILYVLAGDDEDMKAAIDAGKSLLDETGAIKKEAEAIWNDKDADGKPKAPAGKGAMPLEPVDMPYGSEEHRRLMASIIAAGPVTEQMVAKRYYLAKVGQQQALKQGAVAGLRWR